MQSSIKIFLLLAISLLLLARVNAQDINENYAVDTEIAESRVSSTGDFTYEDYGSTENRSEQLIVSNDAPFSLQRKYIVTLIKVYLFNYEKVLNIQQVCALMVYAAELVCGLCFLRAKWLVAGQH